MSTAVGEGDGGPPVLARTLHRRAAPIVLFTLLLLASGPVLGGCRAAPHATQAASRPAAWAEAVACPGVGNLYRVDEHLYRAAQPTATGFRALHALGVRHVLDLRLSHDDRPLLGDLPVEVRRLPLHAFSVTRDELVEAVAFLVQAKGPVLVHCRHGSDRTGTVVAAYRIAAHGWRKEDAVAELRGGAYGFHAFFFPNLPKLLLSLDEASFRADVRQRARQGFVE